MAYPVSHYSRPPKVVFQERARDPANIASYFSTALLRLGLHFDLAHVPLGHLLGKQFSETREEHFVVCLLSRLYIPQHK
jgi:hypothetical protein